MLALVTDLIFATKITSTAKSIGTDVKTVRSLEKLDERLASALDTTVIIDLNADGVDVMDAIAHCRAAAHEPHIIAYVSHMQPDLVAAARAAGVHKVMARSAFVAKLPSLLEQGAQP